MPRKKSSEKPIPDLSFNDKNDKFKYEPKSFGTNKEESLGSYTDWNDRLFPERDDISNHFGPYRDVVRFNNLLQFRMPYQEFGRFLYMREPIKLCQVAWREVPVFYQTIETMTDLTNTDLKLFKGTDRSKKFFESWFKKINLFNFREQFFRETYRSGNMFVYRYDGSIKSNKLNKFTFGEEDSSGTKSAKAAAKPDQEAAAAKSIEIPVRYVVLNPAFVCLFNGLDLNNAPVYYWMVDTATRDQLKRLKAEGVDIDLSKETEDILHNNISETKLDSDKLYPLFYRKQDYEPFAMPMGYPVLDDINLKLEFKKCDQVVAKTVESIMTLVTHGTEDKDGQMIVNPLVAGALERMFLTKQTGRTIVSTSDTKIDFVIPDLKKVVGPEKYLKLDEDINDGLMNIFFGNQKFANIMVKLRVFVQKLQYAQQIFINEFLTPEMRRVGLLAGYKVDEIPIPRFAPIKLDDPTNNRRIIAQLLQLGVLTAKDGNEAMETGLFPDYEDLLENQKEYKAARDKGMFLPLVGGAQQDAPGTPGGRPNGAVAPKKSVNPGFKGASSGAELQYDVLKFRENTLLASEATNILESEYKNKFNKPKLSKNDKEKIKIIATHLTTNEPPAKWKESVASYLEKLPEPNISNIAEIEEIKELQNLDEFSSALLFWSKRI